MVSTAMWSHARSEESEEGMTIIELLTSVGIENVLVQNLINSATNFQTRKDGTAITFMTDQLTPGDVASDHPRKVGLVIWMPTDLVKRAGQV
jgi:hypothetical protein